MYENSKIYKIIDNTNGNIYIGSTIQKRLSSRLAGHVSTYKKNRPGISKEIIKNGDYKIILIENYPCNSRDELFQREQVFIDMYDCINKNRAKATHKDLLEQYKKSHQKHKEKRNQYSRDWKIKNNYNEKNKELRPYRNSWGGEKRSNNNLLCIDLDIFK